MSFKVADIVETIEGRVLCGQTQLSYEVEFAFSSDLLSDVLTVKQDKTLLITGLANIQTIRTADVVEIKVIIIARNKKATDDMVKAACDNEMILIESPFSMFRTSGLLYQKGIKPIY
jgi:predicted transcriptional regulator